MLTSKMTQVIQHPDEPGVSFTLRKLSYSQCEEAEEVKREKALGIMKSLQGIELPQSTPDSMAEARNPANKYDRATVLKYGITAWSYDAPCDEANKADLDESTASWLFSAIIVHSVRSAEEGEASASVSPLTSA